MQLLQFKMTRIFNKKVYRKIARKIVDMDNYFRIGDIEFNVYCLDQSMKGFPEEFWQDIGIENFRIKDGQLEYFERDGKSEYFKDNKLEYIEEDGPKDYTGEDGIKGEWQSLSSIGNKAAVINDAITSTKSDINHQLS